MAKYATIGNIKVVQRQALPTSPQFGDSYYDEELRSTFIFYGEEQGWLQISDDLIIFDGC